MRLDCYKIHQWAPELVPGQPRRAWMDAFPDRHPYRCLPLTMANTTGWELRLPVGLRIEWDGGPNEDAITIVGDAEWPPVSSIADSHFRRGIVTMHTGHLFRTPPGWAVWAMGPPNMPKDGIYPLSGLIETDWLPFPFTMNWQMTRPGVVRFEKGEPYCFITLIEDKKLEEIQPALRMLDANKPLKHEYEIWAKSRGDFNRKLKNEDEEVVRQGWQRHYMHGKTVTGSEADGHVTKRRLKPPRAPLPGLGGE
ncbi:hypothetical protein GC169_10240 [bacterium]|nr:hypothetical protein [bacterium]